MKNQNNALRTFKVLSIFLSYPDTIWIDEIKSLLDCVASENQLNETAFSELSDFTRTLATVDLLQLEMNYVATFDQQRSSSLHLFEHVHGDSRDRGQAMVDLTSVYQEHDLNIEVNELPDYLPLFLEYLSIIPKNSALEHLEECLPILQKIANSLAAQGNCYTAVFNALLSLGNKPLCKWTFNEQQAPLPDPGENLDKDWAEEEIKFLGHSCVKESRGCAEVTLHPIENIKRYSKHGE